MPYKFRMYDKNILISTVIIVMLLIMAVTGTVVFLKTRGSSKAIDFSASNDNMQQEEQSEDMNIENEQKNEFGIQTQDNIDESQNDIQLEDSEDKNQKDVQVSEQIDLNKLDQNNVVKNKNNIINPKDKIKYTKPNNNTIENIKESVLTRKETITLPSKLIAKEDNKSWDEQNLNVNIADIYSDFSVNNADVSIAKKASTETGENLVQSGEIITYTLTVTNNGDRDLKEIYVTDKIPAQTTYVITDDNSEQIKNDNNVVTSLRWKIDIKSKEIVNIEFKVKVNDNAIGTISNIAVANGEKSEEIRTGVITAKKTHEIIKQEKANNEIINKAEIGDIIKYTIHVENSGNIEGNTIIKDERLGEILKNAAEIQGNIIVEDAKGKSEFNAEDLIKGIKVNVKDTAKIMFSIKVLNVDSKIINTAIVGNRETPEDIVDTYIPPADVTLTKIAIDEDGQKVEPLHVYVAGQVVRFKISVKNNSDKYKVSEYEVKDNLPQELEFVTKSNEKENYTIQGKSLSWKITDLKPGETKSIIVSTIIKANSWSTDSPISKKIVQPAVGTGNKMTKEQYYGSEKNKNDYDKNTKYYNCSFHIYNSKKGEIPYEDGTTQYLGGYTAVGFGRVSGIGYNTQLSSVENINAVISTHNSIEKHIVYAPKYNPGQGKAVLWYVAKIINEKDETINGEETFVKYHVDGVIVDLQYSITNIATGSNGITSSETILAKDLSAKIFSLGKAKVIENKIKENNVDKIKEKCNEKSKDVQNKNEDKPEGAKEPEKDNTVKEENNGKIENTNQKEENEKDNKDNGDDKSNNVKKEEENEDKKQENNINNTTGLNE